MMMLMMLMMGVIACMEVCFEDVFLSIFVLNLCDIFQWCASAAMIHYVESSMFG